jgi:hypothetical protein
MSGTLNKEGVHTMKSWMVIAIVLALGVGAAVAGGDKNHGDKGKGEVHQTVGP